MKFGGQHMTEDMRAEQAAVSVSDWLFTVITDWVH